MQASLKVPINILMFCNELKITNEEFQDLLINLSDDKMEGSFDLDYVRIGSMNILKQIISLNKTARIFNFPSPSKGIVFAGLEYNNNGKISQALIQIKVSEIGQSYLSVYSKIQIFREIIVKNLLDILTCIR